MAALKLAFRTFAKTPFVTVIAILSLALGIGANTAIFSLFDQILLKPLPVPDPEALVNLAAPGPKPGSQSCNMAGDCDVVFSYLMFRDLEERQTSFTGVAAHVGFEANLAYAGQTENGGGMLVSGSYFPVLGLQPALGRLFGPSDDQTIGGHFVAVLSHDYWDDPSRIRRGCSGSGHHHQWPADDGSRSRSSPLQGNHPGMPTRRVRSPHHAGAHESRLGGIREQAELLGLPLRPPGARKRPWSRLGPRSTAFTQGIVNEVEAPLQDRDE